MGFLDKFVQAMENLDEAINKPDEKDDQVVFTRTFENMKSFRGTKRAFVTSYSDNDQYHYIRNGMKILGDQDELGCVGSTITLTGFKYDMSGTGIRVSVDGSDVGVVWTSEPLYKDIWNDAIDGVYVWIERDRDRTKVFLFIKLQ